MSHALGPNEPKETVFELIVWLSVVALVLYSIPNPQGVC